VPPDGEPWYGFNLAGRAKLYDRRAIRAPDHETWDQFVIPAGLKRGRLRAPLLHYSFEDFTQLAAKLNSASARRARGKLKPLWVLALRLVLAPPFYFLRFYIGRGLWRAGLYGYALAGIAAHGRWLRDAKMLEAGLKKKVDK
jgi:hypothetical protein